MRHLLRCNVLWAALGVALGAQTRSDVDALLSGVKAIAAPGTPGPLVVFGESAFAVALWSNGARDEAAVAAARMGKGRVVGFGHGGYFGKAAMDEGDTGRLVLNCVRWAAGDHATIAVLAVDLPEIGARARAAGITVVDGHGLDWPSTIERASVIVADTEHLTAEQLGDVEGFVLRGGGFVASSLGWGWKQTHPGLRLDRDHRGNQLARKAGFAWSDGYLGRMPPQDTDLERRRCVHAGHALDQLLSATESRGKRDAKRLSALTGTVIDALRALPPDDATFLPRVRGAVAASAPKLPGEGSPLKSADVIARLGLVLRHQDAARLPIDQVPAAPDAAWFPGVVPRDVPRVRVERDVELAIDGWQSLGLFATAGDAVMIDVPADAARLGLRLRVGCHEDDLWSKDSWSRDPEVTATFPIDRPSLRVTTMHGGLVYLEVPKGCKATSVRVAIGGVVHAPLYRRGVTSVDEWRTTIRHAPGPWAELATRKIVLTLKSEHVRKLDDPESLLAFWDRVMDLYEELGREPLYQRPERIVTDVQISAGYMHSGYPIMTHLDAGARMVDVKYLTNGTSGWGFWHELGHNRQRDAWTFGGTGEVTNNLFSLYVSERVGGVKPWDSPQVKGKADVARKHIASGAPFDKWKSDPFLALRMYAEIQQAFGWDLYRRVFAEYAALAAAERPRSDGDKRDQWLVRMSRAAGRDLSPFFTKWGVPVTAGATSTLADLKPWSGIDEPASRPDP